MQRAARVSPSDGRASRKIAIASPHTLSDGETRQTFPRHLRLLHAADFDNVFQNGQRSADKHFTVLFQPNALTHPRLGFAIAKQKVRLAVGRNRLRRLVRESFRRRAPGLPAVDLVVLAREASRSAGNRDIAASLDAHWARITSSAGKATGNSST